jgi:hypothetical protein
MKVVRPIKACLNDICNKVCTGKNLLDAFTIQNGLKQGDALWPFLYKFALEYVIRKDWN